MASPAYIDIDGSTLEGGGQILRNTVAFSALLKKPVHIRNVREGRGQAGLKAQHAAGLQLLADLCGATTKGIHKGSRTVSFDPSAVRAGQYTADPGTAGSTTLLLQASLPCLFFPEPVVLSTEDDDEHDDERVNVTDTDPDLDSANDVISSLTLRGGTDALHAPPADFTTTILLPFLRIHLLPPRARPALALRIAKRGFFPHGGGELRVRVPALRAGEALAPVALTARGRLTAVRGRAYVSGPLPVRVATLMRDAALAKLAALSAGAGDGGEPPIIDIQVSADTVGPAHPAGSGLMLWASTSEGCVLSASALGTKGTDAAKTGAQAADALLRELAHGGCMDEWMQDQMIIFLALAKGRSVVRTGPLTLHTRTAIWVAETLTDAKFTVEELRENGANQVLISCEGIGLEGRL